MFAVAYNAIPIYIASEELKLVDISFIVRADVPVKLLTVIITPSPANVLVVAFIAPLKFTHPDIANCPPVVELMLLLFTEDAVLFDVAVVLVPILTSKDVLALLADVLEAMASI